MSDKNLTCTSSAATDCTQLAATTDCTLDKETEELKLDDPHSCSIYRKSGQLGHFWL